MKQPIRWGVFTALGAMVLAGHAAPARAAGQAQLVMIILDDTGSMTTTGMAGVTGVIRWDDAVMGAINWVMTDETDFTTPREYAIFTFRNDTVIGGAQNGLKQIYPSATEVGNCNPLTPFDSTTNACIMSTSTSKFGASYQTIVTALSNIQNDTRYRAVVGPNTPLADSLCHAVTQIESVAGGSVRNITFESDGGENSSLGVCSGPESNPFTVPAAATDVSTWGMTVPSWQDSVVRRGVHVTLTEANAAAQPLVTGDHIGGAETLEWAWRIDAHYGVCQPGDAPPCPPPGATAMLVKAQSLAAAAPLVVQSAPSPMEVVSVQPFAALATPAAVAFVAAAPLAAAASSSPAFNISAADLGLFTGLGQSTKKSTFRSYVANSGVVFGTTHKLAGDVDDSNCVDHADFSEVTQSGVYLHQAVQPNQLAIRADLNRDGWVNKADAQIVISNWGHGCINSAGPPPALPKF